MWGLSNSLTFCHITFNVVQLKMRLSATFDVHDILNGMKCLSWTLAESRKYARFIYHIPQTSQGTNDKTEKSQFLSLQQHDYIELLLVSYDPFIAAILLSNTITWQQQKFCDFKCFL